MNRLVRPAILFALLLLGGCAAPPADTVLLGGRVWTGEADAWPPAGAEPTALAIRSGVVVAVGADAQIARLAGPDTRRVDLQGRRVVPGFVDDHVHFISGGLDLEEVQLRPAVSREDFVRRIAERAKARPGEWVTGGNWDHETWGGTLPARGWIDAVTRDTPVIVSRLDGHIMLANSRALAIAGITAKTPDPPGGIIDRDARGQPTGILRNKAIDLVYAHVPRPSPQTEDRAVLAAQQHLLALGVTAVHDMDTWESLAAVQRAHRAGRLKLRVHSAVPLETWPRLADYVAKEGRGDAWHSWGSLKGFVDGSLGARTALLNAPYSDQPGTRGIAQSNLDELAEQIRGADAAGLQLAVHAIGDRAVDWTIEAFIDAERRNGPRDRRFRIEHAFVTSPVAVARMAKHGIIASLQPYLTDDEHRWLANRLGPERDAWSNNFQALLGAGVPVAFGSDWPVTRADPLWGMYSAVTRPDLAPAVTPPGWTREQGLTVAQALAAYSAGNAWARFLEAGSGTLAPGMAADLVVLSQDPLAGSVDLREVRVDMTVVGGQTAYQREPSGHQQEVR
jgi:predicted amidohydrolase YtcJ